MIRILLIDDHSLFRESLSRLLQTVPDFQVVGSFASMGEAKALADRERVDVILLSYDSGNSEGPVEAALNMGCGGRILLVTAGMSDMETVRMLKRGASGIFLKHRPPAQLIEAIRRAVQGEFWLDNRAVRALVAGATAAVPERHSSWSLSSRQRAVRSGLFDGLTNKEIAGRLQISENAVKWALQQLFEKTGARVRSQLVRIVLERYGRDA